MNLFVQKIDVSEKSKNSVSSTFSSLDIFKSFKYPISSDPASFEKSIFHFLNVLFQVLSNPFQNKILTAIPIVF